MRYCVFGLRHVHHQLSSPIGKPRHVASLWWQVKRCYSLHSSWTEGSVRLWSIENNAHVSLRLGSEFCRQALSNSFVSNVIQRRNDVLASIPVLCYTVPIHRDVLSRTSHPQTCHILCKHTCTPAKQKETTLMASEVHHKARLTLTTAAAVLTLAEVLCARG